MHARRNVEIKSPERCLRVRSFVLLTRIYFHYSCREVHRRRRRHANARNADAPRVSAADDPRQSSSWSVPTEQHRSTSVGPSTTVTRPTTEWLSIYHHRPRGESSELVHYQPCRAVTELSTAVQVQPSATLRNCSYTALLAAARLALIFINYYLIFGVCDFNR